MFPSVCVSSSLCFRPPVPLPVCTPSVCTLNTVAHRALFHRSLSTYPVLFVLLACPVLSFFPLSYLFIPLLPLFLFLFLFTFSSSLIFSLPILLTLLALPAIHPFELKTLYREQISGYWAAFPSATHLFLSKPLYREHTLRNCDVPLAATHPFELKTLYRERGERCCP